MARCATSRNMPDYATNASPRASWLNNFHQEDGPVPTSIFDGLLRILAAEHHKEVGALQQEIARLQMAGKQHGTLTDCSTTSMFHGFPTTPIASLHSNGALTKDDIAAFKSLPKRVNEVDSKPEEDALLAALEVANVYDDDWSDVGDGHSLEETTPREMQQKSNMFDIDFPVTPDVRGCGIMMTPPPKYSCPLFGEEPGDDGAHEDTMDILDTEELDTSNGKHDANRARRGISFVDSSTIGHRYSDPADSAEMTRKGVQTHDRTREAVRPSSLSVNVPRTLEIWGRLIQYAKLQQAMEALPTMSAVWQGAIEDGRPTKSVLKIDDILASAAKASRIAEGDTLLVHPRSKLMSERVSAVCQATVIHPTCRLRVSWDLIGMIFLMHDLIYIPMQLNFDKPLTEGLPNTYVNIVEVLDLTCAIFWSLDIAMAFRTGFYTTEGFLEFGSGKIARRYIQTWFLMDLLIVSADWTSMILDTAAGAAGMLRLGKTVSRFMRVLRLLRFLKMNTLIKELQARISSDYMLQVLGILKTLVLILVINHYIACFWFGLGKREWFQSSWPDKFLVNYPRSFPYAYTTSLHWSITQFTPASMEVTPQNEVERVYATVVIVGALVAFSSFVSSITAAMTHIRKLNAQKMERESKIRTFFHEHKISNTMASRIWHFLRKNQVGAARRLKESDIPIFMVLPQRIKEELRMEIFTPILTVHPFFSEYWTRDDAAILQICNVAISEKSIVVGEEICRDVTELTDMFFVTSGTVFYTDSSSTCGPVPSLSTYKSGVNTASAGQWFCEIVLWADKARLLGPFVAVDGGVELILINAAKFQSIAPQFPSSIAFLATYAALFMDRFREMSRAAEEATDRDTSQEANVLFNSYELASDMVWEVNAALGGGHRPQAGWRSSATALRASLIPSPLSRRAGSFPRLG